MRNRLLLGVSFFLFAMCLAACSYPPIKPYKIDVPQGNIIETEQLQKVKEGMTKPQVRSLLGTPLLTDVFHDNRWDYIFIDRKAGQLVTQKRATILFNNDKVIKVDFETVKESAAPKAAKPLKPEPKENLVPGTTVSPAMPAQQLPGNL